MARYTVAYSEFIRRLTEVETLRRLAAQREKNDPIGLREEINALSRGAIVLLSSHLEAYIRELGETALDAMHAKRIPRTNLSSRLFYHISKDLLDDVKDTSDPEKIAEKIFSFIESDLPYWSRSGALPQPIPTERFNQGFANPAFKKIRRYLNRFGYEDYRRDLASLLKANYHPTVNSVDHLVDTRNKIAHGDLEATKTPSEVAIMTNTTRLFCRSTDNLFAGWWQKNFCSIR